MAIAFLVLSPISVFAMAMTATPVFAQSQYSVSADELLSETAAQLGRVPELSFVRQEAEKLGVRAFLFGGTASGYVHYVKWDLQRRKNDPRYQDSRFDYDFTNIYRSTQDLDVVIDGPQEKIEILEKILKEKTLDNIEDYVPVDILNKYHLPTLKTALIWIHKPKNKNDAESSLVGVGLSLVNLSPNMDIYGLQVGLYNKSRSVYGLQLGLVNQTTNLHGLQIGLLNIATNGGPFAVSPILNFGF